MKLVSVIIPFYSGVDMLREAVESVFCQTYKNYEVIVINDCSKESLSEFVKDYGKRVTIINKKQNEGPASARNDGLDIAKGDYVAFLDSDDTWLPQKLEKQIKGMESCGAMWSCTENLLWWDDEGKELSLHKSKYNYGEIYNQCIISIRMATPSVLLKKECLDFNGKSLRFPSRVRLGEDIIFYAQLASRYKICLIDEPLVRVRRKRNNNSSDLIIPRFLAKKNLYFFLSEGGYKLTTLNKFVLRLYSFYVSLFGAREKDSTSAVTNFLAKVLWCFPFIIERIELKRIISKKKRNNEELEFVVRP